MRYAPPFALLSLAIFASCSEDPARPELHVLLGDYVAYEGMSVDGPAFLIENARIDGEPFDEGIISVVVTERVRDTLGNTWDPEDIPTGTAVSAQVRMDACMVLDQMVCGVETLVLEFALTAGS